MTFRRWLPPLLWAAFILVLSSVPGAQIWRVPIEGLDKIVHFTCYGVLAMLTVPLVASGGRAVRAAAIVLLAIAVFGALDEWHQQFILGRSMDIADWVADVLGGSLGLVAGLVTQRWRALS